MINPHLGRGDWIMLVCFQFFGSCSGIPALHREVIRLIWAKLVMGKMPGMIGNPNPALWQRSRKISKSALS